MTIPMFGESDRRQLFLALLLDFFICIGIQGCRLHGLPKGVSADDGNFFLLAETMLPLKNLISESYALDISRKCRAVQRRNIASGRFAGRLAPYGFQKSPDDCHELTPDPDTAPIVWQIFDWAAIGVSAHEIARRLSAQGIPFLAVLV